MTRECVLVTGANGFVGRALLQRTCDVRLELRPVARTILPGYVHVPSMDGDTQWTNALSGVSAVVHLASRVHVMRDSAADPVAEFRRVNVDGTCNLARQAARAGVRRFIFTSTVKVNGERTEAGRPFTPDDVAHPVDAYAISKFEAEQGLWQVARDTGLEVVIIRPVLVYGPGVKGNFLDLLRWLRRGIPLPFGAVHNLRSIVSVENLVDLIVTCVDHPSAANQLLFVSDGEDISTTELLRRTAIALGTHARLVGVPPRALLAAARMLGKEAIVQRLCESLQVDISTTRSALGWTPPIPMVAALRRTADDFLMRASR